MTLEEVRSALETAKLSIHADSDHAALKNLLDWAEGLQQFLEITHPVSVPELLLPQAGDPPRCLTCGGTGTIYEDGAGFECSGCGGTGRHE